MSRSRRPSHDRRARLESPITRRELLAETAVALGVAALPVAAAAFGFFDAEILGAGDGWLETQAEAGQTTDGG